MKLWIRNQERDMFGECTCISVKVGFGIYQNTLCYSVVTNFGCVGTYSTRERCEEIFDEISKILTSGAQGVVVYDMPCE